VFVEVLVDGEVAGGGEQGTLGCVLGGEFRTREEEAGNGLFQRPSFNTYPFIPALGFSHGKIFVDSLIGR
jgi:hypothetical protein